jgi:hypothetical protein
MFEAKLTVRSGCKPLRPGKQAEAVRKLRNYRVVANIIEQEVSELLGRKQLPTIEYPRFKMVAREALGLLWRAARGSQSSKVKSQDESEGGECRMQNAKCRVQNREIADKLAEKAEYWGMRKLDPELVREVQEAVVRRFGTLKETNPELF